LLVFEVEPLLNLANTCSRAALAASVSTHFSVSFFSSSSPLLRVSGGRRGTGRGTGRERERLGRENFRCARFSLLRGYYFRARRKMLSSLPGYASASPLVHHLLGDSPLQNIALENEDLLVTSVRKGGPRLSIHRLEKCSQIAILVLLLFI
jgi:hypothetical protein